MRRIETIVLGWIFVFGISQAQNVGSSSSMPGDARYQDSLSAFPQSKHVAFKKLISLIEQGIVSGNVQALSEYFGRQVYITIRGTEGGYYSSNQASYILQNYFSGRRALNFKFTSVSSNNVNPYATGGGTFMVKGNPDILQIYVALLSTNGRWSITQFNIY